MPLPASKTRPPGEASRLHQAYGYSHWRGKWVKASPGMGKSGAHSDRVSPRNPAWKVSIEPTTSRYDASARSGRSAKPFLARQVADREGRATDGLSGGLLVDGRLPPERTVDLLVA